MVNISASSIQQKVENWSRFSEGKRRIKEVINKYEKEGRQTTQAGSRLQHSEASIYEAADKMISVLRNAARDAELPNSVLAHFDSLDHSSIIKMPGGSSVVYIYFTDDLHRPSLDNDLGYEGINNIIALFNNGAHAESYIYGWWDGHTATGEALFRSSGVNNSTWVRSQKDREGLHFIQQAVSDFNGNYGSIYNATAVAGGDYS